MSRRGIVVVVVDGGALVRRQGGLSLDAVCGVRDAVAELQTSGFGVVLVLGDEEAIGRSVTKAPKGVSSETRGHIFQSIGRGSLISGFMASSIGMRPAGMPIVVDRGVFADRRLQAVYRESIRGAANGGMIPLVFDDSCIRHGRSQSPDHSIKQIGALTAGILQAEVMLVLGTAPTVRLARGEMEEDVPSLSVEEISRILESREIGLVQPARAYLDGLMRSGRIVRSVGVPLRVTSLEQFIAHPLRCLVDGDLGTLVESAEPATKLSGVRRWLSTGAIPKGSIVVSEMAAARLRQDRSRGSLLGAGVVGVQGLFGKDEVVRLTDESGRLLGFGLSRYGSQEVIDLRGKPDMIIVHADYFFADDIDR